MGKPLVTWLLHGTFNFEVTVEHGLQGYAAWVYTLDGATTDSEWYAPIASGSYSECYEAAFSYVSRFHRIPTKASEEGV